MIRACSDSSASRLPPAPLRAHGRGTYTRRALGRLRRSRSSPQNPLVRAGPRRRSPAPWSSRSPAAGSASRPPVTAVAAAMGPVALAVLRSPHQSRDAATVRASDVGVHGDPRAALRRSGAASVPAAGSLPDPRRPRARSRASCQIAGSSAPFRVPARCAASIGCSRQPLGMVRRAAPARPGPAPAATTASRRRRGRWRPRSTWAALSHFAGAVRTALVGGCSRGRRPRSSGTRRPAGSPAPRVRRDHARGRRSLATASPSPQRVAPEQPVGGHAVPQFPTSLLAAILRAGGREVAVEAQLVGHHALLRRPPGWCGRQREVRSAAEVEGGRHLPRRCREALVAAKQDPGQCQVWLGEPCPVDDGERPIEAAHPAGTRKGPLEPAVWQLAQTERAVGADRIANPQPAPKPLQDRRRAAHGPP